MAEATLTEEELTQKHKKERKELQAQIQILKKSICKGDKKKKKEITEEIGRLEERLEKRQTEELNTWRLAHVTLNDKETEPEEASKEISKDNCSEQLTHRVSKAQKRREKKAIAEKERNQRIIEQEALNVFGKRNVEIETIKKILSERELMIYEIPSDGHCLYNAVAHQLKINGEKPLSLHDLRIKTADYLRENMNDFLPFLSNPDSDELLTSEEYEKYCNDVAETSAWGGAVELQVLSRILKCPIEVIQATGAPYIIGDEYSNGKKVILTYHRYMYELGAHYNSVTKYVQDEES
ncbi:OTU domain-containing protein 6B [Trachymyrmex septentrionalis]|uniref:ubiquitinyl hydrolase 1 n=1 Tax=Trachymyrmex septentrionalis TaxID=34720 RepID=A0A195FJ55_9HYME|nr:PREDICTED: OTU domain-containing protein 6B [Trachymyrmex septentrionalis]KYN40438.1 OTU domain-containing protein 6B [Trachymyrmex septentrionalis]